MTINQQKSFTLAELCQDLDVVIQGDKDCVIQGVCTIHQAKAAHITFLMNPRYKKYLSATHASAVILTAQDANDCHVNAVIAKDPYFVYANIAQYFNDKPHITRGIHSTAMIGNDCQIDSSVSIGANVVVGDNVKLAANVIIQSGCVIGNYCEIGEGSYLDANITLYHRVRIGKRCCLSAGVVIGSDGFGLAKHNGKWLKVPQLGGVVIGDDVEIGANTTIDRGAIEDTVIENGVKLDNLIQIGHNVRIGENTAIAGCTGVAGSAVIGKNCIIGGNAGIAGHITIGDNIMIVGMSEISKSITTPGVYATGTGGVVPNVERRKHSAYVHRLEQLFARVKQLEKAGDN